MNGSDRCSGFMVLAAVILAMVLYNGLPGGPAAAAADVNTLIFQGSDFHYRGDIDKAIQRFEKALQLDPDNEFAHNQLGLLYAKKGNSDLNRFWKPTANLPLSCQLTFWPKAASICSISI